jgi:hypothetical protein
MTRSGSLIWVTTHFLNKYFHTLAIQRIWYIWDLHDLRMFPDINRGLHLVFGKENLPAQGRAGDFFLPEFLL